MKKRKRVAPQPKKRVAKKSKPILPVAGTTEETVDGDSPGTAVPATAQDPSPDKKRKQEKDINSQLEPPFHLVNRWHPPHKAQCYMMGWIRGGIKKEFVTNVTVVMSPAFIKIMQQLLVEAREGRFTTKNDAVKRRDELLKTFGQDVN